MEEPAKRKLESLRLRGNAGPEKKRTSLKTYKEVREQKRHQGRKPLGN